MAKPQAALVAPVRSRSGAGPSTELGSLFVNWA